MNKITFIIIIFAWCFIGLIGILRSKESRINWEMIIFISFVPFIAVIAYFCGL